jgi:hypothetical protein
VGFKGRGHNRAQRWLVGAVLVGSIAVLGVTAGPVAAAVPPTIAINDVTAPEGNAGSTAFTFSVTMTGQSSTLVSLDWVTAVSTATFPSDFANGSGTVSWAAGTTGSKTVVVQVVGDTAVEPDETFAVNLSNLQGIATVTDGSGIGTITNDDILTLPTLSVGSPTVGEGPAVTAKVPVTLSAPAGAGGVTVIATTTNGSATAPGDYAAVSLPVTIAAGKTTGEIPIPITNDAVDEPTESFTVTLSSPTNATIAAGTGTVTITDDDTTSALTITSTTVTEPASGAAAVNATFTVSLLPVSARGVSVPYTVAGVEATAGTDFTASSGTLTFAPGETSKAITVPVLGDALYEANETFGVSLGSPTGAKLGTPATGTGTIVDAAAPPSLKIADVAVSEGAGSAVLTVTLAGTAPQNAVTVKYTMASGTQFPFAAAGSDFTASSGSLTFAPGTTTRTITIPITNDTLAEGDETFTVTLDTPSGATLARATATVTIVDNDSASGVPPSGGSNPTPIPTPISTPTPTPTAPKTPPTPALLTIQGKVLSAKIAGKVNGRLRATIRLTLDQSVTAKITVAQGKRKLSSPGFPIKFGNRTVYVMLPAFVKQGKVQFQLALTTPKGAKKTLKTFVTVTQIPAV